VGPLAAPAQLAIALGMSSGFQSWRASATTWGSTIRLKSA
jgi:hypothetical protein